MHCLCQVGEVASSWIRRWKNITDGDWFGDRAEGVKVILFKLLMKARGNKTGFIFINGAIGFAYNSKTPFASDGFGSGRRYKFPSVIMRRALNSRSMA